VEPRPPDRARESAPSHALSRASALSRGSADRGALFERHVAKLRVYVEYRLGTALARRVEPEDVVQETFLRAWRDIEGATLSGDGAFFGWLTTIARHVVVDVVRAARAAKRAGRTLRLERSSWSRFGTLDPADPAAGPPTRAAGHELRGRLGVAFRALSPRHQRVLALRQLEQRSARETAARLGCGEMAVHALFRRALDAWARELERRGGPEDSA